MKKQKSNPKKSNFRHSTREEFDKLQAKANALLDFIISRHVQIDDKIGLILAYCFCKKENERITQFHTIVNPNLSAKTKIDTLDVLLKRNYQSILEEFPKLIKNLNKFNDLRNNVAHGHRTYQIQHNPDNNTKENSLILRKYRNSKLKEEKIIEKDYKKIVKLGDVCSIDLVMMDRLIYESEFGEDYLGNPIKKQK